MNNEEKGNRAGGEIESIAAKITNGARENKTAIRWICLGTGIISLLMFVIKYAFPAAEVYFGFTVFYMLTFALYVGVKEGVRWLGIPYNQTKLGEWLGAAWLFVFTLMTILRFVFTFQDPVKYKEIFIVPEEMAWVCGEIAILYALSGISKYIYRQRQAKTNRKQNNDEKCQQRKRKNNK